MNQLTLFLGAGASLPFPSHLPLFKGLRDAFVIGLGMDPRKAGKIASLAPESIIHLLHEAGADVITPMENALSSELPNAIHNATAAALVAGARVWTTNPDTLIEQACGIDPHDRRVAIGRSWHPHPGERPLCKPHGTLKVPQSLVFRAPQILETLEEPWARRLDGDIRQRQVRIVGYRGEDPDLRPVLASALANAARAIWYEIPEGVEERRKRYSAAVESGRLFIKPDTNGVLFVEELLDEFDIDAEIALRLLPELRAEAASYTPRITGLSREHLAAGRILEHLGSSRDAIRKYARAALGLRSASPRIRSFRHLIAAGLYQRASWTRPIRLIVPLLAWGAPPPLRAPILLRYSRLLEKEGRYEASLRAARSSVSANPHDAQGILDLSAATRKAGGLVNAANLARRAKSQIEARPEPNPVLLTRAVFELLFCLRHTGEWSEAQRVYAEFVGERDAFSEANWKAWLQYEHGCLQLVTLGRGGPIVAADALDSAATRFSEMGEDNKAAIACAARITALRAASRRDDAIALLQQVRMARRTLPPYPFEEEVVDLEEAELARSLGDSNRAAAVYEAVVQRGAPVHRVLALLGLGELERRSRRPPDSARAALDLAERIDFVYGAAHALVTLSRSGAISSTWALESVKELGPFADIASLDSLCIGEQSDEHPIIFPS